MKKKILSFLLVLCFIIPCAFGLVACGKKDNNDNNNTTTTDSATAKVMNVSLNPKLEFVLDKTDKVVSVNALNDDGNNIISISLDEETQKSLFEGLSADEAIDLFLEISKDNGYLISGDEEEIKIEISGSAENLLTKVKSVANKFFDDNNLDVNIVTENLKKSKIIDEVKNCMKEYTETELSSMTEEQLIEILKKSRQETSAFFTQELKDVYYNLRLEKLNIAELESLYNILSNEEHPLYSLFSEDARISEFVSKMEALKTLVEDLENSYTENYLSADSAYNEAKDAYIQAKENLLAKRKELAKDGLTDAEKTTLSGLEDIVETAEDNLELAKETADSVIANEKSAIDSKALEVKSYLEEIKTILSKLGVNLESLQTAKDSLKNNFKNHFEQHDNFKNHLGRNNSHWGETSN